MKRVHSNIKAYQPAPGVACLEWALGQDCQSSKFEAFEEIWRSPCWYGSLSHDFTGFHTSSGGCLGFLPWTVLKGIHKSVYIIWPIKTWCCTLHNMAHIDGTIPTYRFIFGPFYSSTFWHLAPILTLTNSLSKPIHKPTCRSTINAYLVGGFNPFEKYESNWKSSPIFGVKIKKWVATT